MKEFIFAGFGGQGVLTAGMILAHAGAVKDLDVTWIPAYGSEMRGGTANCTVKIGQEEISSPFPKTPDVLVAMNEPSMVKFMGMVKKGGSVIVNSSIVQGLPELPGVAVYPVPMNEISAQHDNPRSSNICGLGAAVAAAGEPLTLEDVESGLLSYLSKVGNNDSNIAVLHAGYQAVKQMTLIGSVAKN
ncbi:MAG: 2-oxoacid:acceptor oxidoreductase family protein [Deltaproteobacteria bacterium]|jgi:2-oxoglutarate ferredoxin oxidoreductase subunit gamma|nr:2-oxoacid:acceptor oxidoreductase family protein [Deltaproteobacteria bacterium]